MKKEEMSNKGKARPRYDSPLCEVMEVKTQSIICQSGGTEQYDNVFGNDWFNVQE